MGLGDGCTDDQLTAMAACPSGYIADFGYCECMPNTQTPIIPQTTASAQLPGCGSGYVSIGGACVPLSGSSAIAALNTFLPSWWPWAVGGIALIAISKV